MSSSNCVTALLANTKLTGDKFKKWKSNKNIVLICENHKFVFTEECPEVPTVTTPKLLGISMMLGFYPKTRLNAACLQFDPCRHETTRAYMNKTMKKGVSVKEHVLNMINTMHDAEVHGATINEMTQILCSSRELANEELIMRVGSG
ncbi:uncharacterized protein LOC133779790 [Humulus lupulus]|uniref:uncharacterized protein LOC133779790 n=1 Tax=Humulus lupulus TaxID=3486 RepID=UPI002B404312|nr:uncharacterized protein LOC133779790 [Humulus lupulus]